MAWQRLGRILEASGQYPWMHSHTTLPTPLLLDDRIRVFFQSRDAGNCSRIGYVDLDRANPLQVLALGAQPVLDLGPLGRFDDNGVAPSSVIRVGSEIYLYFVGLSPRVTVPVHLAIGLAVSRDGGESFTRVCPGPIIDSSMVEPYLFTSPTVMKDEAGWHMWYTGGTGFVVQKEKPEMLYHVKYAHSSDGVYWQRDNISCILPVDELEVTARPAVLRQGDVWRMWYCYRGSTDFRDGKDSYRIGFARGENPTTWQRDDRAAGIELSSAGWDSTMLAYPALLEVDGRLLLFYNGNGFGKTGFGCAEWSASA